MSGSRSTAARATVAVDAAPVARAERREMLLDVAAEMVSSGEIDGVSMEAIAERAGVSRPLVYKHFANRNELLGALYQRESAHLYACLAGEVRQTDTLEDKLRALVRGALAAQATRGATFAALAANGLRSPSELDVRRPGDRETLRYFTTVAMAELGLDEANASTALSLALSTILSVLSEFRRRPAPDHAARLVDIYVSMTMGGLRALAQPATPRGPDDDGARPRP